MRAGVRLSRIESLAERLIEFTARRASGIQLDIEKLQAITGPSMLDIVLGTIDAVAKEATNVRRGLLYCGLCNKGPYTKRGMYLHLVRVHRYELKVMLLDELQARINKARMR